jgi:ATP-dependent DNA ligase
MDGEVVALGQSGFPNFKLLQNYPREASRIHFFVFDLLVNQGRDLTRLPLIERREIPTESESQIISKPRRPLCSRPFGNRGSKGSSANEEQAGEA